MFVLCYVVCIVFNITVVLSDVSRFLLEVVDVLVAAGCVFVFVILFDVVGALLYAAGLFVVVGYVSVNCAGIRVDVASLLVEILLVLLLMLLEFLLMLLVFMLMFPFEFLLLIFVMLFRLLLF